MDDYLADLLQEPESSASASIGAETGAETGAGTGAETAAETAACYRVWDLSGLLVATPAARVTDEITPPSLWQPPGSPAWLQRGRFDNRGLPIVDGALLVLPADLAPRQTGLAARCGRILILDGGAWGLALPGPSREESIAGDGVCWRGPRGRRPWLAGTLASRHCILLDVDNIAALVTEYCGRTPAEKTPRS